MSVLLSDFIALALASCCWGWMQALRQSADARLRRSIMFEPLLGLAEEIWPRSCT